MAQPSHGRMGLSLWNHAATTHRCRGRLRLQGDNQHDPAVKASPHARVLASLPAGLTITEVSNRTGWDYQKARRLAREHRYRSSDGRTFSQAGKRKLEPHGIDWTMSNADIARQFGVSRERVRRVRQNLGMEKVESRGRKRNITP